MVVFRVKGKGVKNLQEGLRSWRFPFPVRVQVEVPTEFNQELEGELAEFAALCDGQEAPRKGFFDKAEKSFSIILLLFMIFD